LTSFMSNRRLKRSCTCARLASPPLGGDTLRILHASSRVRPEEEREADAVPLPWFAAANF
jgi:hypothetical protein